MSKLKLWLTIGGLIAAAFLGLKIADERRLEKERRRAEAAERQALGAKNNAAAERARARIAEIDRDLEARRNKPLADRVADAVRESKRRQKLAAAGGDR